MPHSLVIFFFKEIIAFWGLFFQTASCIIPSGISLGIKLILYNVLDFPTRIWLCLHLVKFYISVIICHRSQTICRKDTLNYVMFLWILLLWFLSCYSLHIEITGFVNLSYWQILKYSKYKVINLIQS